MKKLILILASFVYLLLPTTTVAAELIKLVADERNWYPFTYSENCIAKGMHVDIVKEALHNLGYSFIILSYPRKRCLLNVKKEKVDGMISISWTDSLSQVMNFPPDSDKHTESPFRIMQVDYMIITYFENNYEFEGDIATIPIPIRLPTGENIIEDLLQSGLYVEVAKSDKNNFYKLNRDKKGSVITTSIMAENMNIDPTLKGKFNIQSTPLSSKSYYLAFAKSSKIPLEEQHKIWSEIVRLREDYVYMLQLFAQY